MIVAGDEISRTQQGNNNAYCQDNEISWINWAEADKELLEFTQKLISLRKSHPTFCRRKWFQGQPIKGIGVEDIAWFLPDGSEMTDEHWNTSFAKSLAVYLNGKGIHTLSRKGEPIVDDSFYVIFNAHHEPLEYALPLAKYGKQWKTVIDTTEGVVSGDKTYKPGDRVKVEARSIILLQNPQA
jgi:glycogen operon protein